MIRIFVRKARSLNKRLKDRLTMAVSRLGARRHRPRQRRYLDRSALILLPELLQLLPAEQKIVIVDAGARDVDADPRWRPFPPTRLAFYGFEAEAEEAERLNALALPDGVTRRFYPAGLWGATAKEKFEINKAPGGSSLLPQNRTVTDRWKFENPTATSLARDIFYPERTIEIPVTSLTDWARAEGVIEIDFLKMNVQGGELEILKGSGALLDTTLGVFLEVAFVESYVDRPLFSDVDPALRSKGFTFFDLLAHHYIGRANAPIAAQHLSVVEPKLGQLVTSWGQLIEGHALYFRDPLADEVAARFPANRIVKLAALAEAWGQIEFAFEVLGWLSARDDVAGTPLAAKIRKVISTSSDQFAKHVLPGAPVPTRAPALT